MNPTDKDRPEPQNEPPRVQLRIQTPRGLWSMAEPAEAPKRPDYPISTPVQQVIDDVRAVFRFAEDDNRYTLLKGSVTMEPQRPLASYNLDDPDMVLLLSVQGGNA